MAKKSKKDDKVKLAIEKVRNAVADASTGLSSVEYTELFETLIGDADGWKADLEERAAEGR